MGSRVSWSDLPRDMIREIAKRLETPVDIQKFREVCRSWFACCPRSFKLLSLHFPHKIPHPKYDNFLHPNGCFVLVASNIYVLHPRQGEALESLSKPWMVRVEESNSSVLQVQRPLTHNWNIELPGCFPMHLNLSRIRVTEVFKGFNLRRDPIDQHPNGMLGLDVNKVVLYSDSHGKSPANVHDFIVVVLFLMGHLYTVRLSDNHWEFVKFGRVSRFDDVLNFRGEIFVIDRKGRLYVLCFTTLSYVCIVSQPIPSHSLAATRKHLVELRGVLYLVHFVNHFFKVYRLNEEERLWTDINSFGEDKLLFIGPDCCFFALVEDFPGWRGNSIIYHIDSFRTYRRDGHVLYFRHDNPNQNIYFAVYHMGDYIGESIYSFVGYTDVFWPPPAWLRYLGLPHVANKSGGILSKEDPETNVTMIDDQDSSRAPA